MVVEPKDFAHQNAGTQDMQDIQDMVFKVLLLQEEGMPPHQTSEHATRRHTAGVGSEVTLTFNRGHALPTAWECNCKMIIIINTGRQFHPYGPTRSTGRAGHSSRS